MNQKCYILSFQLYSTDNLNAIQDAIRAYGTWAKITDNTWAIVTTSSASAIRDNLLRLLTAHDKIFVIKSGYESAWRNVICRNEWLKENL